MLSVADYIEVQNLINSYPKCLDSGDLEELGRLFAYASVYFEGVAEPIVRDPAALASMYRNFVILYDGKPRTRHIMSNLILREESHGIVVTSSTLVVFQQTDALPLQPIITGDYRDRFGQIDGKWQFLERRISNDLFGDLTAHGQYEILARR